MAFDAAKLKTAITTAASTLSSKAQTIANDHKGGSIVLISISINSKCESTIEVTSRSATNKVYK